MARYDYDAVVTINITVKGYVIAEDPDEAIGKIDEDISELTSDDVQYHIRCNGFDVEDTAIDLEASE